MGKIMRVVRIFVMVLIAALVTTLIASVISTQLVIGALADIGGSISFGERISMTAYDAVHFGTLYAVFIVIALLMAFMAGGLLYRFAKFGRLVIYIAAGAIAMLVMLTAMQEVFFGVPIVGGARDGMGTVLQMVAGGIGGAVFARLTRPKKSAL